MLFFCRQNQWKILYRDLVHSCPMWSPWKQLAVKVRLFYNSLLPLTIPLPSLLFSALTLRCRCGLESACSCWRWPLVLRRRFLALFPRFCFLRGWRKGKSFCRSNRIRQGRTARRGAFCTTRPGRRWRFCHTAPCSERASRALALHCSAVRFMLRWRFFCSRGDSGRPCRFQRGLRFLQACRRPS